MRALLPPVILAAVLFLGTPKVSAQGCPLPPALQPLAPGLDIFSDEQEANLGDAMSEMSAPRIKLISNADLTAHLQELGNRLVQHLPPTKLNFRFYLIDLPEPNAFSVAGGRVYVSRKVIAMAQNEDQLAGVLAHELGHIVTHQSGIYMTRRFREVLGVTQVGDRADVYEKFHRYLENYQRKPSRAESEQKEQGIADQVGLFAMYSAGYSPQAFVDLLDRLEQTHGETGSWITDFFGVTKAPQRRLREAMRNMSALPAGCAEKRPPSNQEAFLKWKEAVVNYTDAGGEELLPGLISKEPLASPLRPDMSNLRFSSDGKYLLAQDEGGIHVLTRDPLAVLFYIPAPDAYSAEFTPDSASIVFHTRSLRVESWSVASHSRSSVHEMLLREPCLQSALSFDGRTLACLNIERDLLLLDVATSEPLLTKKQFWAPSFFEYMTLMLRVMLKQELDEVDLVNMGFSPDDHYFLAGHAGDRIAYDLVGRHDVSLPGVIKDRIRNGFVFTGSDRIIAIDPWSPEKSPILRFQPGERLGEVRLAPGLHLRPVTGGDYILVGPLKDHPVGLLDLSKNLMVISFNQVAADVYDGILANERRNGELALYNVSKHEPNATVQLPQARLGKLRALAVSSDLQWIAFSTRTRGAVWNLARNVRTQYVRSFEGAWFDNNNNLYADFPKFREVDQRIGILSPPGSPAMESYKVEEALARQMGKFLVVTAPKEHRLDFNATVEIRDISSKKVIWSHYFAHQVPVITPLPNGETMLLGWTLAQPGGREELRLFHDLQNQASNEDYFFEAVNIPTGAVSGKVLVKTNKRSLHIESSVADGDWLAVSAEGNQILTFSLASGTERGQFFGNAPRFLGSQGLLAIEKDSRELDLCDLNSQQVRRHYVFSDPIAMKAFSEDGKKMLVLTTSQTVYQIDTTSIQSSSIIPNDKGKSEVDEAAQAY